MDRFPAGIRKALLLLAVIVCLVAYVYARQHMSTGSPQSVSSSAPDTITQNGDPSLPAITVINLIRGNGLGHENDDLLSSLKAQWQVTREFGVRATWLLQYGALENKSMTDVALQQMSDQEFGLLFEIDRNFAEKAGVQFRGQGPWYFSNGLFLNSYDRQERKKLVDTAFSEYKRIFGTYPKTVGAWWIGGDSLTYMQQRYGITAALRAADQYQLDFYSIWGTPWSIPYLAAPANEGMPAASFAGSSKVVILQWAARDPVRGYENPMYSIQDYSANGHTADYIRYLASVYLMRPYGNLVIGLENGGSIDVFNRYYRTVLTTADAIATETNARIVPVQEYARDYLSQQQVFSETPYLLSNDYLTDDQSFWYVSENYRMLILRREGTVYLEDIRDYSTKSAEDFAVLPNGDAHLRINEPDIVDSMRFPSARTVLASEAKPLTVRKQERDVELYSGERTIAVFTPAAATVYFGNGNVHRYEFVNGNDTPDPLKLLLLTYLMYFGMILLTVKNIGRAMRTYLPLLLPLALAYRTLSAGTTFLFDQKEIPLVYLVSLLRNVSVITVLYAVKILPFLVLFAVHYLSLLKKDNRKYVYVFMTAYGLIIYLTIHLPYFPLDRSTLLPIGAGFIAFICVMYAAVLLIYRKRIHRYSRLLRLGLLIAIPVFTLPIIIYSRATYALTPFETEALQYLKDRDRDLLYVEQENNVVPPIYKVVRPVMYGNSQIGQSLSGSKWEIVKRPPDHVLKIAGYQGKLIVVPRYLGSDLSAYEISRLRLKKSFDNAQIAVYESE